LFCAATWIGVQHLEYVEFGVAGRMFAQGAFRRQISAHISLRHYEVLLARAETPRHCWTIIEAACREFNFSGAHLVLGREEFRYDEAEHHSGCWSLRIPLSNTCWIQLTRAFEQSEYAGAISPLVDLLRRTMELKAFSFSERIVP